MIRFLYRSFKGLFKVTLLILTVLTLLWIGLYIALQTAPVRKWAQTKILDAAVQHTGYQVEIEKIDFTFPLYLQLSNVKIAKDDQIIALANDINISLFSPALLQKKLHFRSVHINGLYLAHLNFLNGDRHSSTLPQLPLEISQLQVTEFHLGSTIIDSLNLPETLSLLIKQSTLELKGNLKEGPSAHFILHLTDQQQSASPIHLSIDLVRDQLAFSLRIHHFPLQMLTGSPNLSPHTLCHVNFHGETTLALNDISGRFKIDLKSPHAEGLIDTLFGSNTTFQGLFAWQPNQPLKIHHLRFQSKHHQFFGETTIGEGQFNADLFGKFEHTQEELQWSAHTEGHYTANGYIGALELSSTFQNNPLSLKSDYQVDLSNVKLTNLECNGLGSTLSGELSFLAPDWGFSGSLNALIPDLKPFGIFTNTPIGGSTEVNIALLPSREIHAVIRGKNLSYIDWQCNQLYLTSELIDGPYNFHGSAEGIHRNDFQADTLDFSGSFDPVSQELILFGKCQGKEFLIDSSGQLKFTESELSLHLDTLGGNIGGYPIQLKSPLGIDYHNAQLTFSDCVLQVGEGHLEAKQHKASTDSKIEILANQFPIKALHQFFPEIPFEGSFSLKAELNSPPQESFGKIDISLENILSIESDFKHLPPVNGHAHLELKNESTVFEAKIQGIGNYPILASGTVPLTINLTNFQPVISENTMNLSIVAEGPITPFLNLLKLDSNLITGNTNTKITITGTPKNPEIFGTFDLINGTYESFTMGALYHQVNTHIEAKGSRIFIQNFSALDEKEGRVTAQGYFDLLPEQNYPFEIQLSPSNIYIMDSDYAKISGSGFLTLIGNSKSGKLSGRIQMDQGLISIEEDKPTEIKTVDVTFKNIPDEKKSSFNDKLTSSTWPLELSIEAHIPKKLFIKGDHFSSEWKGDLMVSGTPKNTLVNGELHITNGTFNINGKIFDMSQGTIHFGGSLAKKTYLHIVATKEIDPVHVEIVLQGAAQNPLLSFRSTPPLSEREVLSYILFNRGISDITPTQGNQLNQSFVTLSSSSNNSDDLISKIRNNIGLDRLDLSSGGAETNEFSLQMGKYISENVLIGINKGLNSAANRVMIEAELHKNIKAQGELGDDGRGKIQIKWKKNY